jgi:hypothetical protein
MALEPNSAPPATDLPQLPRSSSWHAAPSTPVDRTGACRFLPRSHGLPRLTGGSASTTSLSRPAQASLALRPARSLARPNGGLLSRGSSPTGYPTKPLGSYHVLPTTTWVDPPSTDDLRRWGALSRNFHSLTRESTALVLLFCEFIGMKAAHLTRIEHTTARRLSHAFRTGGRP